MVSHLSVFVARHVTVTHENLVACYNVLKQ
jgi:hypothetical protein